MVKSVMDDQLPVGGILKSPKIRSKHYELQAVDRGTTLLDRSLSARGFKLPRDRKKVECQSQYHKPRSETQPSKRESLSA